MSDLECLFPPTVSFAWSDTPPTDISLLGGENDTTGDMREGRLREFAHGRLCARRALAGLGIETCSIPVGEARAPVWPAGILGSISHAGDYATAVAASTSHFSGLGIDIEFDEPVDRPLLPMLFLPEELARLVTPNGKPSQSKILFSAKESLFKCIWPTVRRFVDFQEVEIRIDPERRTFSAIARNAALPNELINGIRGRYALTENLIVTSACI